MQQTLNELDNFFSELVILPTMCNLGIELKDVTVQRSRLQ